MRISELNDKDPQLPNYLITYPHISISTGISKLIEKFRFSTTLSPEMRISELNDKDPQLPNYLITYPHINIRTEISKLTEKLLAIPSISPIPQLPTPPCAYPNINPPSGLKNPAYFCLKVLPS
jgi:hypothetical protein